MQWQLIGRKEKSNQINCVSRWIAKSLTGYNSGSFIPEMPRDVIHGAGVGSLGPSAAKAENLFSPFIGQLVMDSGAVLYY